MSRRYEFLISSKLPEVEDDILTVFSSVQGPIKINRPSAVLS